jgi:hypothetical protein
MRLRPGGHPIFAFLILLCLLCVGCATQEGATKGEKPEPELSAQEKSRQEWDEKVVDSPWQISGEYFQQKDNKGGINLNEWWQDRTQRKAEQEETEKRLAALEKAVQKDRQASASGPRAAAAEPAIERTSPPKTESLHKPRLKVALVVLPEVYKAGQDTKGLFLQAMKSQFAGHPQILMVAPGLVDEVLRQQDLVVHQENTANIARALGMYPAARLVLFVNELALQGEGETIEGSLDYTVVDGFSGRSIIAGEKTGGSSTAGKSHLLKELLSSMALTLEKRAAVHAWLSRVAVVEGKRIYLSAGEASGLKSGDILAVYGPGKEIMHPTANVSMGFQPGPYKGKIKVVNLFGSDVSEAAIVAEEGKIEVNDLVAFPDDAS